VPRGEDGSTAFCARVKLDCPDAGFYATAWLCTFLANVVTGAPGCSPGSSDATLCGNVVEPRRPANRRTPQAAQGERGTKRRGERQKFSSRRSGQAGDRPGGVRLSRCPGAGAHPPVR
jgi:hypothetical protein